MTTRRDFLVGAGCLAAAGVAWARTPRNRMSLLGNRQLDTLIPEQLGEWTHVPSDSIVTPQSKDSLAAKLYGQSLGRLYEDGQGNGVMMLIAYGDTQSDQLQLHRPEVCYPAFGFNVIHSAPASLAIRPEIVIPGRMLTAVSQARTEQIAYWTRIGEALPQSGPEQRSAKLDDALAGIIPDGVLVRISNVEADADSGFALNQKFAGALLGGMVPAGRPALIGSRLSRAMAA
jgi:EpsI family protein